MPTPAAGSELRTAMTTDLRLPSARCRPGSARAALQRLRRGARLRASPLFAIGPSRARAGAAARLPGRGPDRARARRRVRLRHRRPRGRSRPAPWSPASRHGRARRPRAAWQAAAAPLIGIAAALGILSSQVGAARGPGDGPARRGRRLLLLGLAAAGDPRPLGDAGAADRPGPVPAEPPTPAPALALRHRSAASCRSPGRCSSGSSADRAADERGERLERPRRPRRRCAPTSPCARRAPATRSASAPRSPPGSPPTGCSAWTTTASGSR